MQLNLIKNIMRKKQVIKYLSSLLIFTTISCIDNNYDISGNNLNKDITIFNEGISIPAGNIKKIGMGEILDINNSENIKTDSITGEYYFTESGSTSSSYNFNIDRADIESMSTELDKNLTADNPFYGLGLGDINFPYTDPTSGTIDKFKLVVDTEEASPENNYKINYTNIPDEILFLKKASIKRDVLPITITIKGLGNITNKITLSDNFLIKVPNIIITDDNNIIRADGNQYLNLEGKTISIDSNNNGVLRYELPITGFGSGEKVYEIINNTLLIEDQLDIEGYLELDFLKGSAPKDIKLPVIINTESVSPEIERITGRFNIQIDPINENINVEKNDIPDFLIGKDACIDIAHASVELDLTGEIPIELNLDGKMQTLNNDNSINNETVEFDNILLSRDMNKIIISDNGLEKEGYKAITIKEMNNLLKYIPDQIDMNINGKPDTENFYELKVNFDYKNYFDYVIKAPMQFGNELNILYNDTIKDWHDTLKDYSAQSVIINGTLEYNIPINANIKAYALDIDGNRLDNVDIKVSPEILKKGDNNISIQIKTDNKEIISELLDGIDIQFNITNKDGYEMPINTNDYLIFKDLKLKIEGGLSINVSNL